MTWQDISTAPRDGRVFLGVDEHGIAALCFIAKQEIITEHAGRWPWSKKTKTSEDIEVVCLAIPSGHAPAYAHLVNRFGWAPTLWVSTDELPPLPSPPEGR